MSQSLTERLQSVRLTVVAVDPVHGRLRVRGEADVCSEITCGEQTLVVSDEGRGGLEALQPGDTVKVTILRGEQSQTLSLKVVVLNPVGKY